MKLNSIHRSSSTIEMYDAPAPINEKGLIVAILERGFRDILNEGMVRSGDDKKDAKRSAQRWLMSNSKKPFSFIWCCLALDLSALAVRTRILEMAKNNEKFVLDIIK